MDVKQRLIELHKQFAEKYDEYIKATEDLANEAHGFIDKRFFDNVEKKYKEWQDAGTEYYNFLTWVRDNQPKP